MLPPLRPYQQSASDECVAHIDENCILVGPTGSGKTRTFTDIVTRLGMRALVVADRREIILQCVETLRSAGLYVGAIMAGEEPDPDAPVQVGSIQTLVRRDLPEADIVVIDECDLAAAPSYKRLFDRYPRRLGATATPFRLDHQPLGPLGFGRLVVAAYPDDLCDDGTLHAPRVFAAAAPDLSAVRSRGGDYALDDLASAVNGAGLVGDIVKTWRKRANGLRTVCFAVSVAHAEHIAGRFQADGVPSEVISGATPKHDRDCTLERLAIGTTTVLVNCQVVTRGWDLPVLECCIMARPTKSLNFHLQTTGRVMRSAVGKEGAVVLDHAGNALRLGLVTDRIEYSLWGKAKPAKSRKPTRACPSCSLLIPAAAKVCPECGFEFTSEAFVPKEREGELVEVSAPGKNDPFRERERRWYGYLKKGDGIARFKRARAGQAMGLAFTLDPDDEKVALGVAIGDYRKRYGDPPIHVGRRLVDPATVDISTMGRLQAEWIVAAQKRGYPAAKVAVFVERRLAEVREIVAKARAS